MFTPQYVNTATGNTPMNDHPEIIKGTLTFKTTNIEIIPLNKKINIADNSNKKANLFSYIYGVPRWTRTNTLSIMSRLHHPCVRGTYS